MEVVKEDKKQVYTRIEPELFGAIKEMADQLDVSMADVFRMALADYVGRYNRHTPWWLEEE